MAQQPSPPVLPFELVQEIIQTLDGEDDRPTLLTLLQVSTGCWEAAARVLYRTLVLTKDRIERLFLSGGEDLAVVSDKPEERLVHLGHRTRRALSFTVRVELHDIGDEHIYLLWAATIPDIPLFPNSRQVLVRHYTGRWRATCWFPEKDVPQDVDLFDQIDLCVLWDQAFFQSEFLPAKKLKQVNIHGVYRPNFHNTPYPDEWEELRWFVYSASGFADRAAETFDNVEKFLDDIDPDSKLPPVQHLVGTDVWEDATLGNLYRERGWVPSPTSRIQISFDTAEWRAPPCVVCGEKFDFPLDTQVNYKGAPHWFNA
ncbi:hypothetical protein Q8F55_007848 [Vanrija albida]|uniref:F-box domain-containing protein n=1 Tax=Vanrija albida TaxID=181172 RepID=A0ABR3PVK1_9TREE